MTKMTSAYANKMLRKLNEDKEYWRSKELTGYVYVAALDEEPVIPEYDYKEVAKNIEDIDEKIIKIKHAVNATNAANTVSVGNKEMTIDTILIRMAQLNKRKMVLDNMRKQEPKRRIHASSYGTRKTVPEYQYINYDLDLIRSEYDRIDTDISEMQIALDKYNQTVEFEVDI
ncbi:MAG: hypothetical protein K6A90_07195 [Lachnospiraceae bacterium]|nr:hypothetical protein [Lachnospiraceae bacterium]